MLDRLRKRSDSDTADLQRRLDHLKEYVDKTLHLISTHSDLYAHRSSRPYFPLNEGWGLTRLSTGQPFYVNTRDRHVTPWVLMGGHWETHVDRVLCTFAQPGMTVVDIGCHIGYYTVKLATKVGEHGFVHAFDPNPEVADFCLENMRINGFFGMVRFHPMALSDKEGTASLSRASHAMASANIVGDLDTETAISVPMKPLDAVVTSRVDLIKLDAEGSEVMVLKGAKETIARSPDCALMIELGIDRWERAANLSDLVPLCGDNGKVVYGVHQEDGTLERLSDVRAFVDRGHFREQYVFVARPQIVEAYASELIRR